MNIKFEICLWYEYTEYIKMAWSWTCYGSTPSSWQKWVLDLQTSNLMSENPNYDSVTERLTPVKIGKYTLMDQILRLLEIKFDVFYIKAYFCQID